jgi:hypothetical protein
MERALLINALQKTRVTNLGFNSVTQHDRRNADVATDSENHGHCTLQPQSMPLLMLRPVDAQSREILILRTSLTDLRRRTFRAVYL